MKIENKHFMRGLIIIIIKILKAKQELTDLG